MQLPKAEFPTAGRPRAGRPVAAAKLAARVQHRRTTSDAALFPQRRARAHADRGPRHRGLRHRHSLARVGRRGRSRCGSPARMVFGITALAMFATSVIYHWEREPGAQAAAAQARPLRHLSTHRRHLHAVHAGGHAGRLGLVPVRRGVDAGGARHRREDHGRFSLSAPVDARCTWAWAGSSSSPSSRCART